MNTPNFSDIYTLYFEDVYKYLLALCHDEELAEELAQDTFFKAKLNGVAVEEKLFPVGSVRLTATADAPELPGTWQQVQAGLSGVYAWRRVT